MKTNFSSFTTMLPHIRWVLKFSWRTSRLLFVIYWTNLLLRSLLPAAAALALRGLINSVSSGMVEETGDFSDIVLWLAIGLVIALCIVLTDAIHNFIWQRFFTELNYTIQLKIIRHSGSMDYAYFEDPAFRDIMHKARQKPGVHLAGVLGLISQIAMRSIQLISILLILIAIEPIIFFLLLPIAVPNLWWRWRLARRRFKEVDARTEKNRWQAYYTNTMTQENDVAEIKLLNLAPLFIERARVNMDEFRTLSNSIEQHGFIGSVVFGLLSVIVVYIALARATFAVVSGGLTIGDIAIYGGAAMGLRSIVESIMGNLASLRFEILHIINLRKFLAVTPQLLPDGHLAPNGDHGEIEFRNVTFSYPGTKRPVLSNTSFRIEPGETVALVGENGAGKTTIAKLIVRFYDPDQGVILYNKVDLRSILTNHLRRQIALVLQSFSRFSATAADNIAFGDWEKIRSDRQQTKNIARKYGVHDLIEDMPDGYDTMLGRTFGKYQPSGGQWQQLAITRAMVRDAKILILDEPTANLDVRKEFELFSRFRELAEGRTTILISHRFSTVSMADRILVVDQGQIVENGTHDELMQRGGLYATLYRLHREQMAHAQKGSSLQAEGPS